MACRELAVLKAWAADSRVAAVALEVRAVGTAERVAVVRWVVAATEVEATLEVARARARWEGRPALVPGMVAAAAAGSEAETAR